MCIKHPDQFVAQSDISESSEQLKTSLSSNFSSSSSGGEAEETFYKERGEFSGCVPYDENLELLAGEEEAA